MGMAKLLASIVLVSSQKSTEAQGPMAIEACAAGAKLPLPPRHVIATTTGEDGSVTHRWYDDALTKARFEFADQTLINSCNDGQVMKTSHDSVGCQITEEPT